MQQSGGAARRLDGDGLRTNRGIGGSIMFGVAALVVLGIALVSRSFLVHGAAQPKVRATLIASAAEHQTATAEARATYVAQAVQAQAEATIDAQLASRVSGLKGKATAVARGSATARVREKATSAAQARARREMAARLRAARNADGSQGLYDPVTGVAVSAGSAAIDVVGRNGQSSRRHTYLWMIAVEINDGSGHFPSTPGHFRMVGPAGAVHRLASVSHLPGSDSRPMRSALVFPGQTNQGFLAFALPPGDARSTWTLLWREEADTAWRTLCRVNISANGRAVLLT